MKKSDVLAILIIGEIIAVFLIFVLKNLGHFSGLVWFLLIILPFLAIICLAIAGFLGKKIPVIFQLAKFISVGLANTAVDFGILNLLMFLSGVAGGLAYSAFKGISFIVAIIHSYFWNKFWTFRAKNVTEKNREFLQFFLVSLVGFAINVSIASIVVNAIGVRFGVSAKVWANIGAACGSVIGLAWNFLGYKFIVFKQKNNGQQ